MNSKRMHARRWIVAALTVGMGIALPVAAASQADADGGSYPSNAPTLTPGQEATGGATNLTAWGPYDAGKPGVQYWKLPLQFGDRLRVDFAHLTGSDTDVCVYSPAVTDYTLADASCLAERDTDNRAELTFVAPKAGTYLLAVSDGAFDDAWAYSLTAYVSQRTAVTLRAPARAGQRRNLTLTGTIAPAGARKVALKAISPAHGWRVARTTTADQNGHFTFHYRPGHTGLHRFKAIVAGTSQYSAATSNTVRVAVAPR